MNIYGGNKIYLDQSDHMAVIHVVAVYGEPLNMDKSFYGSNRIPYLEINIDTKTCKRSIREDVISTTLSDLIEYEIYDKRNNIIAE